jgi:hypothetical protein
LWILAKGKMIRKNYIIFPFARPCNPQLQECWKNIADSPKNKKQSGSQGFLKPLFRVTIENKKARVFTKMN